MGHLKSNKYAIYVSDCTELGILDLSKWNTQNVTMMRNMFSGCSTIDTIKLNNFDMSKAINHYEMFKDCGFNTLVTPKIGKTDATLPYTMYDDNGISYTKLPSTSKTLYKKIEYTVTLNANGGNINDGNITSYIPGTEKLTTNVTKQDIHLMVGMKIVHLQEVE